jgi:hypothetical protein
MKVINVKDFTPAPGMEWQAHTYPGNGAYLSNTGMLYLVANGCVNSVPGGVALMEESAGGGQGGVSEGFILKALAIAQNPQLAAELTK